MIASDSGDRAPEEDEPAPEDGADDAALTMRGATGAYHSTSNICERVSILLLCIYCCFVALSS